MPLARSRAGPLVRAGFGFDHISKGGGAYGRWLTGMGFIVRLGRRFSVRGWLDVTGLVPDSRFEHRFACLLTDKPCSLRLEPSLGFGVAFG